MLTNRRPIETMLKLPFLAVTVVVFLSAQDKTIDVHRSTITVHVRKAGLFSAAGHEHWANAPIFGGLVNDSPMPHVEFKVATSKIEVKSDPKIDAKTQAEIQNDMQQKVLESSKYPEINFQSSHAEKRADDLWKVQGALTLHGVTKPITLSVTRDGDSYSGNATIKQTDFGIEPVTAGGGLIKVKNELEISFHIVTKSE
jgi:polyisoprenoid-binding protein YceI